MKILALSDTQLGAGRDLALNRLADQEAALQQIAGIADERNIDVVLHCGDVYEQRHPTEEARMVFKRFARRIDARRRLIVIAGNHCISAADRPSSIDVHDGFEFVRRPATIDLGDATLACLPWAPLGRVIAASATTDRDEISDTAEEHLLRGAQDLFSECTPGKPAILALHWWLETAVSANGRSAAMIHEPAIPLHDLAEIGYQAIVAGHVHKPQILHVDPPVFYCGPPTVCNFGEADIEHGVWIIDTDRLKEIEFVPLTDRAFVTVDCDLAGTGRDAFDMVDPAVDETDVIAAAIAESFPLDDAVVRIRYTATDEQHRRIDPQALRRLALTAGAHKVYAIEPTIIRPDRARAAGFDRGFTEHEALTAWCQANEIPGPRADALHELLADSRALTTAGASSGAAFDPVTLTATNVGRFHTLTVDFTDGATVLLGPNGSGKSTALRCLELALYAKDAGDLRDILAPWADQLDLELTFTLNHETHRVRRSLRGVKRLAGAATGGRATLDLEREHPDGWQPMTRETAAATQAHLVALLGMSRALFRSSCFLGQGDAPAFLKAEPRDRKAMAAELLDPAGLWAADAAYANAKARDIDAALTTARARADHLQQTIDHEPAVHADLRLAVDERDLTAAEHAAAEKLLDAAMHEEAANAAAAERARTAGAEHAAARDAADRARAQADHAAGESAKLPAAREKLAALEQLVARVPDLERLVEEQRAARDAHTAASRDKDEAVAAAEREARRVDELGKQLAAVDRRRGETTDRITHLQEAEDGAERCPVCEQTLGAEARRAAITSLQVQRGALEEQFTAAAGAVEAAIEAHVRAVARADAIVIPAVPIGDYETPLAEARAAGERAATGRVLIQGYEELAAQVDALQAAADAAASVEAEKAAAAQAVRESVRPADELALSVARARREVATAREALAQTSVAVARLEQRQADITTARQQLAEIHAAALDRQALLDTLKVAERAFGRDGIPVLLLETVLPQIDADANAILRRFPTEDGWTFSVRFETQREQATTDRLKEELYVMVDAPDYPQDFRSLSGGEESRVAFGIRVALAMLLGRLRGADSRVLVLDELPWLDEGGERHLVDLVNDLVNEGTFSKVLTVSHSPGVRDAFENTVEIRKDGGVSTVAARVVREAVAV